MCLVALSGPIYDALVIWQDWIVLFLNPNLAQNQDNHSIFVLSGIILQCRLTPWLHEHTAPGVSVRCPGGPHDVFKGATHLSLERAQSSNHNRDRGHKQMVHKRCGSSQTDWTEFVVSVAIPTVSCGSSHRRDTRDWCDFHMADPEPTRSLLTLIWTVLPFRATAGDTWCSCYLSIISWQQSPAPFSVWSEIRGKNEN